MKSSKYVLFSLSLLLSCGVAPLFADMGSIGAEDDNEALRQIRRYVDAKRNISIKDKGGSVKIGGEVKVTANKVNQKLDGQQVQGKGQGADRNLYGNETNIPGTFYEVEAALSLEYRNDKSFANILMRMANHAGIDGTNYSDLTKLSKNGGQNSLDRKSNFAPSKNKLDLARAYIGHELYEQDSHKIVGNVGRQRLYDLFDSRVMFVNRFDGIAFKYTGAFEGIGHAHATAGAFMISDRVNQIGTVLELGLNKVADSNFGVKYSIIDWAKGGNKPYSDGTKDGDDYQNNPGNNSLGNYLNEACRYIVSQAQVTYDVPEEYSYGQNLKLYAAYLFNHKAYGMKNFYDDNKDRKNNRAWYAGFTLGKIAMPGDWLLDANYQYVLPQSVPDFDSLGGAGRGNLTGVWGVLDHSQGNNNFKGVMVKGVYCLSPEILLKLTGVHTNAADTHLSSKNNLTRGMQNSDLPHRGSRNGWTAIYAEIAFSF